MKSDSRTVDYPVTAFRLTRRNALKVISLGILTLHLAKSPGQTARTKPVRIVTLGDSITKGVRPGVNAAETFAAVLESRAKMAGYQAEVVNVGIGGERTDQALARFDQDVIAKHPDILTVMYGANDSYVDPGKTGPRISPASFRENLAKIVERAQAANIRVVLMTEPRWGAKPPPNGLGEHPNLRLAEFMKSFGRSPWRKKFLWSITLMCGQVERQGALTWRPSRPICCTPTRLAIGCLPRRSGR